MRAQNAGDDVASHISPEDKLELNDGAPARRVDESMPEGRTLSGEYHEKSLDYKLCS